MRVLIVDDELWSRQLIKKVLDWSSLGFKEVLEASNGEEAVALLKDKQISLTITDMRMPKMDGADLMKYIRNNDCQTEIIVMSGYEDYNYLHEALKTKAIDYLLKPVVKSELNLAVSRAIDIIRENQSYEHIEEILRNEDLKVELNKYYEVKNLLFKALIVCEQKKLIHQLERLEALFVKEDKSPLYDFMKIDMSRFITRLQKEYSLDLDKENSSDPYVLKDMQKDLLQIMDAIVHKEVYKKVQILDVQTYIDAHYTESITLADVADTFHVSKEHLSRLFKKQVGVSVQHYITNKKIDYAKRLMKKHPSLSVSTVSVMSGYIDLQYFYRVFKKETGLTPIEYKTDNINIIQ